MIFVKCKKMFALGNNFFFFEIPDHHHHHQPINVPTAGALGFLMYYPQGE
jgi:hypothetical protein